MRLQLLIRAVKSNRITQSNAVTLDPLKSVRVRCLGETDSYKSHRI